MVAGSIPAWFNNFFVAVHNLLLTPCSPGMKKNKANGLSQHSDYEPDPGAEVDMQVFILLEYFINAMVTLATPSYLECLQHGQHLDKEIAVELQDPNSC
jgi:hypothetical protein